MSGSTTLATPPVVTQIKTCRRNQRPGEWPKVNSPVATQKILLRAAFTNQRPLCSIVRDRQVVLTNDCKFLLHLLRFVYS